MSSVFENIPEKWWADISNHFASFPNDTTDFNRPLVRKSFQGLLPVIIFFYVIVILLGASTNIAMLAFIIRHRLFKDPTILFLGNEALSNIIKCIFLLPILLCHLLLRNWVYGHVLCLFLPILHHFPFYVSALSFLSIAVHRYLFLRHLNAKSNKYIIYSVLFNILNWIVSIGAALPYALSVHYFEVGPDLSNASVCVVDVMERFIINRYVVIIMFLVPFVLCFLFHGGAIAAIKRRIENLKYETDSSGSSDMETSFNSEVVVTVAKSHSRTRVNLSSASIADNEFKPIEEKRTQKYLFIIFLTFLLYISPLNILYFFTQTFNDEDENRYMNIVYITLVLLTFFPSCITPALFTSWIIKRPIMNEICFLWSTNIFNRN